MPLAGLRRSLALSFLDRYSSLAVQLAAGLIVARLITPEAFGVFAIAYAIVGFAQVIRDMGVNSYLVRLPVLEPWHVRAGLFVTGVTAWSLGAVLLLLCPLVARLYGPAVREATTVLVLSFFITPVGSTIVAALQREMDFAALLRINLAGVLVNAAMSILLAARGHGAVGLAWASVAGQAAVVATAALHRPHAQHFAPSMRGAGQVFRFGSAVMLSSLLHQFSTNIASLITARFVSHEAMGLMSRGQSVTGLFGRLVMDAVSPLLLPLLARVRRDGGDTGPAFWQIVACLAAVTWPFFLFLALYARPIIVALFGEPWAGSAELLRLMSIGGLFWLAGCVVPPVLTAAGRVGVILRAQLINQAVALAGVLLAAPHGIRAVAAAAIPISAAHAVVWMAHLPGTVRISPADLRHAFAPAAAVALTSLLLPAAVLAALPGLPGPVLLMLGALGTGSGWLAGVFLTRHPLAAEIALAVTRVTGSLPRLQNR